MDSTSEGKGSTTFPAQTEDGIEDVKKDVTIGGQAVVFTDEAGNVLQEKGGRLEDVGDAPVAMNSSAGENATTVEALIPDDESDEVKAMEAAIEEDTGTRATLTASEAQALGAPAMEAEAAADAPAEAPEAEASDEVDATPAAEAKAEELGVDLASVEGSGADGRVTVADVEDAADEA